MVHLGGANVHELACVVLSVGSPPTLVDAVRSLCRQRPEPEILVVNSGGGCALGALREAGLRVQVVNRPEPLLPGAARNLGIEATKAPFVAFLAADCLAEPGWVDARVEAHRAGVGAVASVMTNASPPSRSSCASHLLLYSRRLPTTAPSRRLLYGVSYNRSLFERLGRFREDLREGEDTDFNARVAQTTAVAWNEAVRTAHRNPTRPLGLLRDQYARGRRSRAYDDLSAWTMVRVCALKAPLAAWEQTKRTPDPRERRRLRRAMSLVPPASLAFATGLLVGRAARTS
jgi:glycosyltransferase involved in cell wall biosynthesis